MADDGRCFGCKKTFCLVTGASRGLGRSIAINFASAFSEGSKVLLTGRNAVNLEAVKAEILTKSPQTSVCFNIADLSNFDANEFDKILSDNVRDEKYEQAVIVHNAGSLGDATKTCKELVDISLMKDYFDLNFSSMAVLNALFLKHFTEDKCNKRIVVHISSLAAILPFKTWSLYCSGKAARDMFFKVLAKEETSIRVLSYAPGPCNTDMGAETRTLTGDKELRETMEGLHTEGKVLACDTTVKKLLTLLENDKYESGAHIDFYDD